MILFASQKFPMLKLVQELKQRQSQGEQHLLIVNNKIVVRRDQQSVITRTPGAALAAAM